MSLCHIKHQRADMQIRILCECGGSEACSLKHWALGRTAPHQVIPDPEAIYRRGGQERSSS
jgi:hypothetical protein